MKIIDPRDQGHFQIAASEDSRWHEVWQLVIRAERQPLAEQRDYILSSGADSFAIGQALAILDGSASMASYSSTEPSTGSSNDQPQAPRVGMKVGRYRVGALLGSGATGSVFAGFDEELNRAVAIKFFSPQPNASSGSRERTLREARAASALNHPNIIMIHEVIDTGDAAAIVMELVPGQTLRVLAADGPRLSNVLHWCAQLANALSVAHANQLVHGDIKPENVMVREDGYVKLLDFGLAFDAIPDRRSSVGLKGTPRYLSPEQCLGQPPSMASDIFSFGAMLYELAAGRHPFEADGMLALLQAITTSEPRRPASLNRRLPASLDKLILEMIAKRPEDRPTAQQIADRLSVVERRLTTPRMSGLKAWSFAALGVAAVVGAAALYVSRQPRGRLVLSRMRVHPMASQAGLETAPSISPDGLWISSLYRARASDRPHLQIRSMPEGPATELPTGDLILEDGATWSPDSNELAFVALSRARKRMIYRTRRTGGQVTAVGECLSSSGSCGIDWSPDGKLLAVSDVDREDATAGIFVWDLASGNRRPVIAPGGRWVLRPRFSPDGKWIAFSRQVSFSNDEICVVPASGGSVRCVTRGAWWISGFAWKNDGQSVIAIAAREIDKPEMWQFSIDGRSEPYQVASFDVGRARDPSISRRTGALAWVRDMSSSSLWRMPVDGSSPAELLVSSSGSEADAEWSSNGRMVFRSDRSGSSEIWIARADGSEQRQATRFHGPFVGDPHWSPDGRSLAFSVHANGNPEIYTVICEGEGPQPCGNPVQMTRSPSSDANPIWSLDGQWIYFSSNRTGRFEVWKAPAGGGTAVQITWHGGYFARESVDGKWLYYSKVLQGQGLWRMPLTARGPDHREELVVPHTPFRAAATWVLGAHELYYYPSEEEGVLLYPSVRAVDLETRQSRELATGNKILGRGLSQSPDGKWLLRSQSDRSQSLIMIAE